MSILRTSQYCYSFYANTQTVQQDGHILRHRDESYSRYCPSSICTIQEKLPAVYNSYIPTYCTVHNNFGKSCPDSVLYWNRQTYNAHFLSRLTCFPFYLCRSKKFRKKNTRCFLINRSILNLDVIINFKF